MEIDPVWAVCEVCGVLVGRAGLHAAWHNPPEPEPEPEPDPDPVPEPVPDPGPEIESEK